MMMPLWQKSKQRVHALNIAQWKYTVLKDHSENGVNDNYDTVGENGLHKAFNSHRMMYLAQGLENFPV